MLFYIAEQSITDDKYALYAVYAIYAFVKCYVYLHCFENNVFANFYDNLLNGRPF